jgi:hypothetical protein
MTRELRRDSLRYVATTALAHARYTCMPVDDRWLMGCCWARARQSALQLLHLKPQATSDIQPADACTFTLPSSSSRIARDVRNESEHEALPPAARPDAVDGSGLGQLRVSLLDCSRLHALKRTR